MLLLLRKDMHFYFLMEVRRLLIIFQVGCAVAAAGAYATDNTSTVAERGAGYCFLIPRFGRSHCDASDVNCCCCTWVLLFMPFSLLCFGCGCWLRCCWDGMLAGKIHKVLFTVSVITYAVSVAFSIAIATVEKGYAFFFFWWGCCGR